MRNAHTRARGAAISTVPLNCIWVSGWACRQASAVVGPATYAPGSLMNAVRQPIEQKA